MRRTSPIFAIALLLIVAACGTVTAPETPLQLAEKSYVEVSIGYEAAMNSVQSLRAAHLVTDAQWNDAMRASDVVRATAPQVRALLDLWHTSGTQPAALQPALDQLTAAAATITAVKSAAGSKP